MTWDSTEFREALASGDADRVNAAIEAATSLDRAERAKVFKACFDALTALYREGDGYQRLSVVRFLRGLAVPELDDEALDELWAFYVEAIQDDDGRVRQAAEKGIIPFALAAEVRGDPVEPLQADLAAAAAEHTGETRADIEAVRDRLQQAIDSPLGDIFGEMGGPGPPREWDELL